MGIEVGIWIMKVWNSLLNELFLTAITVVVFIAYDRSFRTVCKSFMQNPSKFSDIKIGYYNNIIETVVQHKSCYTKNC